MGRYEQFEELALAMAQSTVSEAIYRSPLSQSGVAKRLGINRAFIAKILRGDYNLTVKTLARVVAACGFELRFSLVRTTPPESGKETR